MKAMILEDDVLMAELLETILAGLYTRMNADIVTSEEQALAAWEPGKYQLLICDWNLPDGSGLDVVRKIRKQDQDVPILMISGRSDRDSVLAAAHYRISGFISKPFRVEMVRDRLKTIFPPETDPETSSGDLEQMLADVCEGPFQLPTTLEIADILELMQRPQELDVSQLAERWREETGVTTRLLEVANRSRFKMTGEPVRTLEDAIKVVGTQMSLNLALGLALDTTHSLTDSRLRERAEGFQSQSESVGTQARVMFRDLQLDSGNQAYTAGLLSLVGELVVLSVLQQYLHRGDSLDEGMIDKALKNWAQPCGNRLKVQWRLPLDLRELIGAIHSLPRGETHQDRIVMRAAALVARGDAESSECQRLLSFAGLDPGHYTGNVHRAE
ncbi:HDOD domain-containing protein [Marinobacter mobilis]|uniref:HD-like signal output (HDOD) domain, no enzymatic activity n=1 Tax=Marinobacter mobilis TaxID=488533 RepID=A0A1H2PYG2_9GAMM|nr:HDOD domain-containing protein [Marinobacter mobilis]SDV99886.1 HD-like signal output (HDOD) domain, no enzymatic activity [Marinobacter mobilis]